MYVSVHRIHNTHTYTCTHVCVYKVHVAFVSARNTYALSFYIHMALILCVCAQNKGHVYIHVALKMALLSFYIYKGQICIRDREF